MEAWTCGSLAKGAKEGDQRWMDTQTLERALRSALDEVEQADAIIEQQKKDRDALRERIGWLSHRALFFELASASGHVLQNSLGYLFAGFAFPRRCFELLARVFSRLP